MRMSMSNPPHQTALVKRLAHIIQSPRSKSLRFRIRTPKKINGIALPPDQQHADLAPR
jgi:hypothetical protein